MVDCRQLNKVTITDTHTHTHPLPLIGNLLENQSKFKIFTAVESKGFHHIPLHKESMTMMNLGASGA